MGHKLKSITIYVDEQENLILIPTSVCDNGFLREIDEVVELRSPYSDDQLVYIVKQALERCHSKPPDLDLKLTVLEKYLNIKGYAKATMGRRLIGVDWLANGGYIIVPTVRDKRGAYRFFPINEHTKLAENVTTVDFANSLREAIKKATY